MKKIDLRDIKLKAGIAAVIQARDAEASPAVPRLSAAKTRFPRTADCPQVVFTLEPRTDCANKSPNEQRSIFSPLESDKAMLTPSGWFRFSATRRVVPREVEVELPYPGSPAPQPPLKGQSLNSARDGQPRDVFAPHKA